MGVGGTTLTVNNNTYGGESGWSGSGGGISKYENQPSYQKVIEPTLSQTNQPRRGLRCRPVLRRNGFDSYKASGWLEVGGTSAGAPQWAGLFADVNQARATLSKPAHRQHRSPCSLQPVMVAYYHL